MSFITALHPKRRCSLIAWPEPPQSFGIVERLLNTGQIDRFDCRRQKGLGGGNFGDVRNPAGTDLWDRIIASGLEANMQPCLMRFHANYVSAAEAGDYYQVSFETEDPANDGTGSPGLDRPYLVIQRQFETPDGRSCYVETHDHGYVGHYRLRLIDFSPTRLAIEIERNSNTHVEVSCALDAVAFNKVRRIVNIIFDRHG
jgi:hypothetical protein